MNKEVNKKAGVKTMQIPYYKIEGILGDNLVFYKGTLYETVEDIKLFPDPVTLILGDA